MKKIVLMCLSLVLVVALTIGGTLAFLTDRDSEANVFTVGNVDIELNEVFNNPSELMPGMTIDKVVKIENTGANDAWVWYTYAVPKGLDGFLNIAFGDSAKWDNQTAKIGTVKVDGIDYNVYASYYKEILKADATTDEGMKSVSLKSSVDYDNNTGKFISVVNGAVTPINHDLKNTIVYVNAYAIQTEDFATVYDAYNAYIGQWGELSAADFAVPVSTAEELAAAVAAGGTYALTADIAVDADTVMTVPAGVTTTLDLNGYTIAGVSDESTGNRELFLVKGVLNIEDGTVTMKHEGANMGWGSMSAILDITAGGVANVTDATIENLGGTDMNFGAHLNNWGTATLNLTDSTITAPYCAIRVFNSGYDMNTVNATGTKILSGNNAFWVHNYTAADFGNDQAKADAAKTRLNINIDNESNIISGKFRYGFTNAEYNTPSSATAATAVVNDSTELKAALQKDATVVMNDGTYNMGEFSLKEGVTLIGGEDVVIEGTLKSTLKNVEVKDVTFKGGNAQRWAYASGSVVFEDCTFDASSVYAIHYDGTSGADIVYKNCDITGWVAIAGGHNSLTFDGCRINGNGTYGVIRTYSDATIKNCTFDVAAVNTTDVYQDGIHAVDCNITVENCTNVNGAIEDIFNVSGTGTINGLTY